MNPQIFSNILDENDFRVLKEYFYNHPSLNEKGWYDGFGRILIGDGSEQILKDYSEKLLPIARSFFSPTLLPSYSLFAEYSADNISLHKHKDSNACTYTIDLILYQNKPWALVIEDKEYFGNENDAILFLGEDQIHWREEIKNNTDRYGVVWFHYVEPDHWWFTEGPDYVSEIRKTQHVF